jgi:hypothetical protein
MFLLLFDMGLPMIIPSMFIMLLALIPVIFIEGHFISKDLKIEGPAGYQASLFSNLISTLIGIPVTWFLLVMVQLMTGGGNAYGFSTFWQKIITFTWQAPWLIPYFEKKGSGWLTYAAMIFLLIPYFFASWYIEYFASRSFLAKRIPTAGDDERPDLIRTLEKQTSYADISQAIWKANLITYGGLALLLSVFLLFSLL